MAKIIAIMNFETKLQANLPRSRSSIMTKVLCFDFDDTIMDSQNLPIDGVKEVLERFKAGGCKILINSARFDSKTWGELVPNRVKEVEQWFKDNQIPFDAVVAYKPPADIYIDDKGFHFQGQWKEAERAKLH